MGSIALCACNTALESRPPPVGRQCRCGIKFWCMSRGGEYYTQLSLIERFCLIWRLLQLFRFDFQTSRIWDRGALVAVRPQDRENYVAVCDSLLEPGGRILLATYDYDQEKRQGASTKQTYTEAWVGRLFMHLVHRHRFSRTSDCHLAGGSY